MKALSIRQPWASLIVAGIKNVENRSWKTDYTGKLIIHAGKQIDPEDIKAGKNLCDRLGVPFPEQLPTGGFIGVVEMTGLIWEGSKGTESTNKTMKPRELRGYNRGGYGFYLENPKEIPLVPAKGKLGLFFAEKEAQEMIQAHLAS